jgi:soluble lytic murein transglycosylase-like protein
VNAVSSTGAKGLGQLKDATAQWLGVKDAFNPIDNLNGTAKYLSYLADQFPNDPARAVASYFVGQGNVKRDGLNDSALQYIIKVQRHLDLLLSWGAN